MNKITNFLSRFPLFENEKQMFSYLEDFLADQYLIRPMLVYSSQENVSKIILKKARLILGKTDRCKLYSTPILEELLSAKMTTETLFLIMNHDNSFYYYINLGIKRSQNYFALFSSNQEIPKSLLEAFAHFSAGHLKIIQKYDEYIKGQELIHIDDVTGLFNQRKLYKDLKLLIEQFQKFHCPFCVLFIDIDHFKRVNDKFGHLIGTKLLEDVASDIKKLLRDADSCYRYGGDEFVIILADSVSQSGKIVGERILSQIKSKTYEFTQQEILTSIQLSVSIGVAEFPSDAKSSEDVLALADRMMYEAKESGRGVVFSTNDIFQASLKKVSKGKDE
jgi:diguanylate cyclase (GGDEF)-like protein